ncbi:hypothetical protein PHYSODRAFT_339605 [Phytophthora sojae]|uniref:Protein kinase domain-containing protein n=1 Tax=Phytophthora sojae (strain P6497) TaxID=1094619 RepID=G5A558_PHYSP|nr:hypothetical protein PHYSODRAFT_339605 [Phytophthora sojae]EGZ09243.1 hypothetical protein PHYSODRAFT_339605 [Phytophthora sojae]|eukprot:XP_009535876.1 hypothetical protein PHYSODRAFT_339605 [Phytophthora sojae]
MIQSLFDSDIGTLVPNEEKWFIARHDVRMDDESFNRGAFGKIYRGLYVNADVVVKCVAIELKKLRGDFLREVKIWHEANHPKIVPFKAIVHSDLKGDNVLVDGGDTAMLTDFGMSFSSAGVQPGFDNLGAIRWRAPEFVLYGRASFEADVYSLGMVIVEAVTEIMTDEAWELGYCDDEKEYVVEELCKLSEKDPISKASVWQEASQYRCS